MISDAFKDIFSGVSIAFMDVGDSKNHFTFLADRPAIMHLTRIRCKSLSMMRRVEIRFVRRIGARYDNDATFDSDSVVGDPFE